MENNIFMIRVASKRDMSVYFAFKDSSFNKQLNYHLWIDYDQIFLL